MTGKKIKFALKLKDGVEARNLQELKEFFDLNQTVAYFLDGKLETWLLDRYYNDLAEKIGSLDKADPELRKKLCEIFEVEYEEDSLSVEEIEERNRRIRKLKEITDNEDIIKHVDKVAFSQEELADLLDDGQETIYLCGTGFHIPVNKKGIRYIGIETKLDITKEEIENYQANDIELIDLFKDSFDESKDSSGQKSMTDTNNTVPEGKEQEEAQESETAADDQPQRFANQALLPENRPVFKSAAERELLRKFEANTEFSNQMKYFVYDMVSIVTQTCRERYGEIGDTVRGIMLKAMGEIVLTDVEKEALAKLALIKNASYWDISCMMPNDPVLSELEDDLCKGYQYLKDFGLNPVDIRMVMNHAAMNVFFADYFDETKEEFRKRTRYANEALDTDGNAQVPVDADTNIPEGNEQGEAQDSEPVTDSTAITDDEISDIFAAAKDKANALASSMNLTQNKLESSLKAIDMVKHDDDIRLEITDEQYQRAEKVQLADDGDITLFENINGVKLFNLSLYKKSWESIEIGWKHFMPDEDKFAKVLEVIKGFISEILKEHGYDSDGNRLEGYHVEPRTMAVNEPTATYEPKDFGKFLPNKTEALNIPGITIRFNGRKVFLSKEEWIPYPVSDTILLLWDDIDSGKIPFPQGAKIKITSFKINGHEVSGDAFMHDKNDVIITFEPVMD